MNWMDDLPLPQNADISTPATWVFCGHMRQLAELEVGRRYLQRVVCIRTVTVIVSMGQV